MKTMSVSRFSSSKRLRQRAMPSPPNKAELKVGRTSVRARGAVACCFCHKRKAVVSPMKSLGQVAMHDHRRFGALGKLQQMPGMLALLENPILNHTAPIIGIEDHEGIAHLAIG